MMNNRAEREVKFDTIYRTYRDVVFKIARLYVKDDDTASDIMQDTFFHFHTRMEDVSDTSIKAYLVATAKNLAFNHIRDSKHEIQTEEIEQTAMKVEIPAESAEEEYLYSERKKQSIAVGKQIMEELRVKNESWYEVVDLWLVQELDDDEISERLGITKEALYSRKFRAKAWLQKEYRERLEDIKA